MSSLPNVRVHTEEQGEIARLLSAAVKQGQHDVFQGKRIIPRYYLGAALEVYDPASDGQPETCILHNISAGGLGFWSKRPYDCGVSLSIREHDEQQAHPWIAVQVRHSTLGMSGHLIGALFENQPPAGDDADAATGSADGDAQNDRGSPLRRARTSLSGTMVRICGFASAAGAALAALAMTYRPAGLGEGSALGLAIILALGVGALAGWAVFSPTARFLRRLSDSLRRAQAPHKERRMPPAPTREFVSLLEALNEQRNRWRSREDDERVQRQKLEELNLVKSNILNTVSHDLRTPLTSIRLYAEMLAEEMHSLAMDDQQRFLGIITEECKRLSRLVDGLLEAQRLEAGRVRWDIKPQDLTKLVRACALVFEPMARSKSIELTIDCPESLPAVEADADRMSQVLSNLVSNALKYTQVGGAVRISARATGGEVVVAVADNGPGVPREKWDQIFDRFAQVSVNFVREISGVGLGLYIVRQIVSRHGGRVWIDSEVGRGSAFYVALPVQTPESEAALAPPPQGPTRGRVLVCDADPDLAAKVCHVLRRKQYDVRIAHSGCRLLTQLVECQPDVVLTDLLLPDMDSPEVLAALNDRKLQQPFKLIVHTYVGDGPDLRRRGVDIAVARPAQTEELLLAVEMSLRRDGSGKSVLIALPENLDIPRIRQTLAAARHVPITTAPERALQMARDYPLNAMILGQAVLAGDGNALRAIRNSAPQQTTCIVVVDQFRRRDRRIAAECGAELVLNRRGLENPICALVGAREEVLVCAT